MCDTVQVVPCTKHF